MVESDKVQFGNAVGAMLEAFGQEATKARLYGYWLGLRTLELPEVESAVASVLENVTDRFPPPPAKLREIVNGGSSEDLAIAAWADVQDAMPLGAYRHVDFEDKHINAAIRSLGGWPAMFERCATTEGEKWYRIEFCKAYASAASRQLDGDVCRPLAGISEKQLVGGRIADPVPMRIGSSNGRARICAVDQRRVECRS